MPVHTSAEHMRITSIPALTTREPANGETAGLPDDILRNQFSRAPASNRRIFWRARNKIHRGLNAQKYIFLEPEKPAPQPPVQWKQSVRHVIAHGAHGHAQDFRNFLFRQIFHSSVPYCKFNIEPNIYIWIRRKESSSRRRELGQELRRA